jgi:hypothetical protein
MVKDTRDSPSRTNSKSVSSVGRLGIPPPPFKHASSIGSPEYNISLDDSSSIHSSDFSKSSSLVDDSTADDSKLSRLRDEVLRSLARRDESQLRPTSSRSQASSTGSSSGSPWVDDSDSSSCTSSRTSLSSLYRNGIERLQFDEARSRMIAQQKLRRARPPLQLPRPPSRGVSPSSVSTGKHPSKPIDVTGKPDVPVASSLIEQVRQARLARAAGQAKTCNPRRESILVPLVKGNARIVGLVPRHSEVTNIEPVERHQARVAVKHTVPHVVFPKSRSDEVSTMGGTFPDFKATLYQPRHPNRNLVDMERGRPKASGATRQETVDTDHSRTFGRWLGRRTDLELCLICLVVSSLVTVAILLAFMVSGS